MPNTPRSPLSRKSVDFPLKTDHHPPQPPIELEVVILGASRVGKTAIAQQFLWRRFNETYRETVEDFNWIEYECGPSLYSDSGSSSVENPPSGRAGHTSQNQAAAQSFPRTFMLKLIDTSGSNEFLAMRDLNIQKGHAFILVHSPDEPQSLDEVKRLKMHIAQTNLKNAPVIVVTNKIDLALKAPDGDPKATEFKAKLDTLRPEIEFFVAQNDCAWMEVSAKDYESVERIFRQLLHKSPYAGALHRQLKKRRQSMPVDVPDGQHGAGGKAGAKLSSSHGHEEHTKNGCVVS